MAREQRVALTVPAQDGRAPGQPQQSPVHAESTQLPPSGLPAVLRRSSGGISAFSHSVLYFLIFDFYGSSFTSLIRERQRMEWRNHSPWINNCISGLQVFAAAPRQLLQPGELRAEGAGEYTGVVAQVSVPAFPRTSIPQGLPSQEGLSRGKASISFHLLSNKVKSCPAVPPAQTHRVRIPWCSHSRHSPAPSAHCALSWGLLAQLTLGMLLPALQPQPRLSSPKPIFLQ